MKHRLLGVLSHSFKYSLRVYAPWTARTGATNAWSLAPTCAFAKYNLLLVTWLTSEMLSHSPLQFLMTTHFMTIPVSTRHVMIWHVQAWAEFTLSPHFRLEHSLHLARCCGKSNANLQKSIFLLRTVCRRRHSWSLKIHCRVGNKRNESGEFHRIIQQWLRSGYGTSY